PCRCVLPVLLELEPVLGLKTYKVPLGLMGKEKLDEFPQNNGGGGVSTDGAVTAAGCLILPGSKSPLSVEIRDIQRCQSSGLALPDPDGDDPPL
ncbi:hypothetical protein, partial [Gloeomargarita lithophora]|uniref:hypothetical protein n=1 Tax=Gloeomargarita lithophora TaxID=1188228 RepID=UPI003F707BC4